MLKAFLASIFGKMTSADVNSVGTVADEPIAARAYSGFYQPEADVATAGIWVTNLVSIPMAAHPGETVRLAGAYYAKSIAKQTGNANCELVFSVNGVSIHSATLRSNGDFVIEFVVPELNDIEASVLVIRCTKWFVPKDIGPSEDDRWLSWRMKTLRMGPSAFLDFTRQPDLSLNNRFTPAAADNPDFSRLLIRAIAFYRPQFRTPQKSNSEAGESIATWGKMVGAAPFYANHHQPNLPVDLGCYDVRAAGVLPAQVALARKYGIAGFCFDYSGVSGEPLADIVLNQFLSNPALDIGFCLCWKNEIPAGNTGGQSASALTEQQGVTERQMMIFTSLSPAFSDARYIRVDEKPILLIKDFLALDNAKETAAQWQTQARQQGLPGLYLIAMQAAGYIDPREYGFDAVAEFPPHQIDMDPERPGLAGLVCDYRDLAEHYGKQREHNFASFKTVMPVREMRPLNSEVGNSYVGATPEAYASWISQALSITAEKRLQEQLLFIHAWNAWGEGAYLEPDQCNGYGYLHATAAALRNKIVSNNEETIATINQSFCKLHDAVVILHVFYEDLIDSIFDTYLSALTAECDLIVTVLNDVSDTVLKTIKQKFDNCFIIETANRGRDIRPFVIAYRQAYALGYLYACKLHTKKSPQKTDGAKWRMQLFDSLLTPSNNVASILNRFKQSPRLGLLAPKSALRQLGVSEIWGQNFKWLNTLSARLGQKERLSKLDILFPAGSMYWFRITALSRLLDESFAPIDEFEFEAGQLDGTLAHALERIVGMIGMLDQYEVASIALSEVG